uniref:Hepcidin n=1 Tax=Salarias fasciatus TaxID=181472 RepID=A0A672GR68_SALFA
MKPFSAAAAVMLLLAFLCIIMQKSSAVPVSQAREPESHPDTAAVHEETVMDPGKMPTSSRQKRSKSCYVCCGPTGVCTHCCD